MRPSLIVFFGGCAVLAIVFGIAAYRSIQFDNSPEGKAQAAAARAYGTADVATDIAHQLVRRYLKHPDDATFPANDGVATWIENGQFWRIEGKVIAKNTFGAALTYPYVVAASKESGEWTGLLVIIDDDVAYADEGFKNRVAEILRHEEEAKKADIRRRNEAAMRELDEAAQK